MPPSLEDKWRAIADEAIQQAERVECSLAEFAGGLLYIEREIRDRRDLAQDEERQSREEGK